MSRLGSALLVGSLAAAVTGCAGNGKGLDANGNPLMPGGGGSTEALTADFKSIQDNVFTPICTKCHIGGGAPEGLQLDAQHSYAMLVGVPSAEQPNLMRIDPGNPDQSYLVLKLQGSPGISGARMPFGGPYLPQSTIDVIRQWVMAGAMNTTSSSGAATAQAVQRFTVKASSPDPDSMASVVPRIVVAFNAEIDPNMLNNTTVSLEKLATTSGMDMSGNDPMDMTGPMGSMAPMNPTPAEPEATPVAMTLAIPRGDGSALLITPRAPLGNGTYRVTLRATLADMGAHALGSDYTFKFTVEAP